MNETDKKESEGNASEEKDVTLASEGVKMDTSQPLAEGKTNHENVPSSGVAFLLVTSPVSIGEDLEYEELLLADRNTHVTSLFG